jgi:hypothetical protein
LDHYLKNPQCFYGLSALVFGTLACQPVIAIGWREGLFIFLLMALLIGPPVYRFFRRLEDHRKRKDS